MAKGLDGMFVNYGIRKEDMNIIKTICEKNELDFDWVKEYILKEYHSKRVNRLIYLGYKVGNHIVWSLK